MKKIFLLLIASTTFLYSEEKDIFFKERKGVIEDSSHAKITFTDIAFEPEGRYHFRYGFPGYGTAFYVIRDMVELSIPKNIISEISFTKDSCSMKYDFMGKSYEATGKIIPGKFNGKSEFGDFTLETAKVIKISFMEPAATFENNVFNAHIELADNRIINACDLKIVDLFVQNYQDSMYINVSHTDTFVHKPDEITIKVGETEFNVPLNKIKRLDFKPDSCSVEMKSGSKTEGKCEYSNDGKEKTIEGICGICEEGGFFIKISNIRSVTFD